MLRNHNEMQGWHALALLFCGMWAPRGGKRADAPAPIGGTLLMLGWALLLLSAWRAR